MVLVPIVPVRSGITCERNRGTQKFDVSIREGSWSGADARRWAPRCGASLSVRHRCCDFLEILIPVRSVHLRCRNPNLNLRKSEQRKSTLGVRKPSTIEACFGSPRIWLRCTDITRNAYGNLRYLSWKVISLFNFNFWWNRTVEAANQSSLRIQLYVIVLQILPARKGVDLKI